MRFLTKKKKASSWDIH